MKNYVQPGISLDLIAPGGGVTSGVGYIIGQLLVVAAVTAAAAAAFAGTSQGVFEMPVNAADTPAAGNIAYWDNSAKEWRTASATGRYAAGTFVAAKVGTLVKVKLNGYASAAIP